MKIQPKARIKETEKNKFRAEAKKEEQKRQDLLNEFKNESKRIDHLTHQINQFASGKKIDQLKTLETDLNSIAEEISEYEEDRKNLIPEIEQLKQRVNDQKSHREDIERNIELLDLRDQIQRLQDEQDLNQEKLDQMNLEEIRGHHSEAKQNIEKYTREKDRSLGSKDSLMVQKRDLKVSCSCVRYQ